MPFGGRTADGEGGLMRDVYLRGSQQLVFTIGRDLAARPLVLRVQEPDGTRYDGAYRERMQVRIDAVALGEERTLPTLTLPDR